MKKPKEYRIMKKYYRNEETAKVEAYYAIEYIGKRFSIVPLFFTDGWKEIYKWLDSSGGPFKISVHFKNLNEATVYLDNLKENVYADEPTQALAEIKRKIKE